MSDRPSEVNEYSNHFWIGDSFNAVLKKTVNGRVSYHTKEFNFGELRVKQDGFLAQLLENLVFPALASLIYLFHKIVVGLCESPSMVKILSTPVSNLRERDLVLLAIGIEQVILNNTTRKAPRNAFHSAWVPIRDCGLTLGDGTAVAQVQFESSLPAERAKQKKLISDTYEPNIADPTIAEPITAPLDVNSDLGERIKDHLNKRIEFIIGQFKLYIAKFLFLAKSITKKKAAGFPDFVSSRQAFSIKNNRSLGESHNRYTAEQRFHIYCYRLANRHYSERVREQEVVIYDYPLIADINTSGARGAHTWMLADKFLPWETVLSIAIILQIETCWNNGPLLSLDKSQVTKTQFGYILSGSKSKTEDLVPDHEIKTHRDYDGLSDEERLDKYPERFCVELLLRNLDSINQVPGVSESRLFLRPTTHTKNEVKFVVVNVNWSLEKLCRKASVEPFSMKQLRDQAANRIFFRDGKNIHHLMVMLGHKSLSATTQYLDTGIVALESEANVTRFTVLLEQSILFVSGREMDNTLGEEFLSQARALLFPISDFADEPETCLLSVWFKSRGGMKLYIDEDAVAMCSIQKHYYTHHAAELAARDPDRFRDSHLPLIVACTALHRIISKSSFNLLLKEYDDRYQKNIF
jgi:integrase